ncbi:MAG: class I SAM-dependent RNA methyltransferase [Chitinophagales bacterium]|nr:class I SAM-dependent RNA methyltransferase [Chitinophagales bacterium]
MQDIHPLFSERRTILISSSPYITTYVKQEVVTLGFQVTAEGFTTVETSGTFEDCMLLNLHLRTANHVYFMVEKFTAATMDELYSLVTAIEWEKILPADGFFSVHNVSNHEEAGNTMFLNLRVKDAIADRFMKVLEKRPDSGSGKERAVLFIFWKDHEAFLYIDTSGEPLTKHGYRKISMKAPLQESLAAAMIMATKWNTAATFINPMCGSGTLAIEAALMACNKSPGLIRSNYGFMHVSGYAPSVYDELLASAEKKVLPVTGCKIIASDKSIDALEAARSNAQLAGVQHLIQFIKSDFESTPVPEEPGVVMFNPPYGERLGASEELEMLYAQIGNFLKKSCRGYWGYIFTANPELAKKIGLKTKRKIDFYNGQLKCKLLEFELYEGTKKRKSDESGDA